jgi:hypothetical protein
MIRKSLVGTSLLLLGAAACFPIFLLGCFTIPYPSLMYVPSVSMGSALQEAHCFRAEVTAVHHGIFSSKDDDLLLEELPISQSGRVDGQFRLSIDSSRQRLMGGPVKQLHEVRLRLYRPGYQTVEITSKDDLDTVTWTSAPDSAAQEQAVDDLLALAVHDYSRPKDEPVKPADFSLARVQSGSASAEHRKALLYCASEYERLATQACPVGEEARSAPSRLLNKAEQIRELAAK